MQQNRALKSQQNTETEIDNEYKGKKKSLNKYDEHSVSKA